MSSTRVRAKNVPVREQLIQYVVSERGDMIALYTSVPSCVIKIKNVADRVDEGWHYLLRSEVM